jgi:undecaprenyl-diphosphatase
MNLIQTIILSIIEGLTEFLPVSSTGHMIIASSVMGIEKNEFVQLFEIAVQLGAILAVVVLYYKKFFDFQRKQFYIKLLIAVIPALILGSLFSDKIDLLLGSPTIVAVSILAGGIVLLFVDNWFKQPVITDEKAVGYRRGFIIGIWQCLAMVPGVSRSASSIIGGMSQKLDRRTAAEFSFFLAVPTMVAATGHKLLKTFKTNPEILKNKHNIMVLGLGNLIAFVVALIAVKYFIEYLQKHGFKLFGWYRIVLGAGLLVLISMGYLA